MVKRLLSKNRAHAQAGIVMKCRTKEAEDKPMKRPQEHRDEEGFHTLCRDVFTRFSSRTKPLDFYKLFGYVFQYSLSPNTLESLLNLERKMMSAKGPRKHDIEEHIFQCLDHTALDCASEDRNANRIVLSHERLPAMQEVTEDAHDTMAMMLLLFVREVFAFTMPRDSFASTRKALALRVVTTLYSAYDIPEALELSMMSLKSGKPALLREAFDFYARYAQQHEEGLPSDVLSRLETIVKKTRDRSIAVGALDLQVKIGHISELGALSHIDAWKAQHDEW